MNARSRRTAGIDVARVGACRCAGASLLEVLVAVSLLATSLLGMAAAQIAAVRDADTRSMREHASWEVASIAEAMRVPESSAPVLARARASIHAAIPNARISFADEASDVGTIMIHWARIPGMQASSELSNEESCGFVLAHGPADCVAWPFAGFAGGAA